MSVSNGTTTVSYDYDAEGQLVRRKTNGVVDRYFLWDNGQLVAEFDSSATTKRNEFAYQPGVDQPLARIPNGGSIQFFQLDGRGNVAGLASGTTAIQSLRFGPWGDVERQVGDSLADTRLGWKGLLWDGGVSSLYYVRARWYDPQSRSFLSEDPAGLSGGPNTYAFAGNDPVNGQDPAGMSEENCTIIWGFWYNPDTGVIDPGRPFILNSWCDGGGGSQGGAPTPTTPVAGGGGGSAGSKDASPKASAKKELMCRILAGGSTQVVGHNIRTPDFYNVNLNITIPTPWTATLLSWSGTLSIDRYGDWYWSPIGLGVGKAATVASLSVTANWMNHGGTPSARELGNMLSSFGANAAAGFWGGVSESWTPGAGTATGVGLVTPQIGVSANYSFHGGNVCAR